MIAFPRSIQSSVKMTKNRLQFDLEIYKEQQNGKVYHLLLTLNLYIRLKDLYRELLKKIYCDKYKHLNA